jgi:hypothetical protein
MKLLTQLVIAATIVAICGMTYAQSLQEQFQSADAELNRVYKELRSQLNDEQKAELKKSQLAWIKEKDRLAKQAGSESNSIKVLVDLTKQRAQKLADKLDSKGKSNPASDIESDPISTFQEWPNINEISGFCISSNHSVV